MHVIIYVRVCHGIHVIYVCMRHTVHTVITANAFPSLSCFKISDRTPPVRLDFAP